MFLNLVHKLTKRYTGHFSYLNSMIRKYTFDYFLLQSGFHLMIYALALDKGQGAEQAVIIDFTVLSPGYRPVGRRTAGESPVSLGGTQAPGSEAQHTTAHGTPSARSLVCD